VLSTADAHGPVGRTVLYLNCELLEPIAGVAEINSTVRILASLLNPPSSKECAAHGVPVRPLRFHRHAKVPALKLLGSRNSAFGRLTSGGGR
jgi:hypothetical protein